VKAVADEIKTQYDKLANDWRHFNTIIWGIPSVAVAIMATIIIAAYQKELEGWPRIASLSLGSLLLFALTIETVKKRHHMNAMSLLLKRLQEEGLKLEYRFPVGISDDIDTYISSWEEDHPKDLQLDSGDRLFNFFKHTYARKYLTWVVFIAAIVVALLAEFEFVKFFKNDEYVIIAGIVVPLIILVILLIRKGHKGSSSSKSEESNKNKNNSKGKKG
jgi:hypothetical protein